VYNRLNIKGRKGIKVRIFLNGGREPESSRGKITESGGKSTKFSAISVQS
jgi:hypothetical protein